MPAEIEYHNGYEVHGKCRLFPLCEYKGYKPPEIPRLPIEEPNTDFKRKYPADTELGQELADNARVWKVYRDEAIQHDDGLLHGWNNTIDILLTFAGLFSAAVTAFVVESYQFLQPVTLDLGAALYALAVNDTAMLHALATSSSQPSSSARWINGLWFTSLFFSLVAAFLCILVKQWLDEYRARTRASSQNPKHWSRRRAFYFRAIDSWGVPIIISLLPLLLHAALFLFFAGMVVLLWSLNRAVAGWLSGLALLALLLYVVSLLIPVWNAACPFATPLARLLRRLWTIIWAWTLHHAGFVSELAATAVFRLQHIWTNQSPLGAVCPHPRSIRFWLASKAFHDTHERSFFDQVIHFDRQSDDDRDLTTLDVTLRDELDCDALCWLILSVSDNDAGAVGFQALGAAEPYSPLAERLIARGVARASQQRFLSNSDWSIPAQGARVVRTFLLLRELAATPNHPHILGSMDNGWEYYWRLESGQSYPDIGLLSALVIPFDSPDLYAYRRYQAIRDAPGDWILSSSLRSTSLLLTTIPGLHQQHILLFLVHCDLEDVPSRHWILLMPKLWGTAGPCPRHGSDLSDCSGSCLPELFSWLILQGRLDGALLVKLWDKACMSITAPLSCLPTFSRYIISDAFLDHAHEPVALQQVQYYIDSPNGWRGTTTLPAAWMTAWRYLAFLILRSRSQRLGLDSPFNLIAAALSDGKHPYYTRFVQAPISALSLSAGDFLRSILLVSDLQSRPIPSLWTLVCEGAHRITPSLDIIAAALCTLSRSDIEAHELIPAFLEPMHFPSIILRLSNFEQYNTPDDVEAAEQPSIRATLVRICVHLMELSSSWWTEGMNQLMHEVPTDYDGLRSQRFAEDIMAEALAHGPCCDCPHSVTSLEFDISLRNFRLFPFAVYPLVVDSDPYTTS